MRRAMTALEKNQNSGGFKGGGAPFEKKQYYSPKTAISEIWQ